MYRYMKRLLDIVLSLFFLLILFPIMWVIALLIKIDSKGPVIYTQERMGIYNTKFRMYKFRTMVKDADKLIDYMPKDIKKEYLKAYKLDNDRRVTKVGKFLRKSSLDELPQFINVIKNDMSIIGPRPIIYEELKRYNKNIPTLLSVKPGITGNWAVCGRSNISYKKRMELELYYANEVCFILDLKIFFKTIYCVIKKIGAK